MRPEIRMIREELRREAERVPIPEDMWQRISAELEQDLRRQRRCHRVRRRLRALRPFFALTVVGGVLGAVLKAWPVATTGEVQPAWGSRVAYVRPPKDNLLAGYFVAWMDFPQVPAGQEGGSRSARVAP